MHYFWVECACFYGSRDRERVHHQHGIFSRHPTQIPFSKKKKHANTHTQSIMLSKLRRDRDKSILTSAASETKQITPHSANKNRTRVQNIVCVYSQVATRVVRIPFVHALNATRAIAIYYLHASPFLVAHIGLDCCCPSPETSVGQLICY